MASLRERSASRSENSCPSNSVIFRSAGCAWPRSEIPEPVVNSCLPLASPGPYNSTPSPVWYTVCDVVWAFGRFHGSREAPVSAHHSKNLQRRPQGRNLVWKPARFIPFCAAGSFMNVFHANCVIQPCSHVPLYRNLHSCDPFSGSKGKSHVHYP